jgi:predicted transcriptional regulator
MNTEIHMFVDTGYPLSQSAIERAIAESGDKYFHKYIKSVDVKCGEVPYEGIAGYAVFEVPQDRVDGMETEILWYVSAAISRQVPDNIDHEPVRLHVNEPCNHENVEAIETGIGGPIDHCTDCGKYL